MLIDSHCHLDFPALSADRAHVRARAKEAGITLMLNISTGRDDMDAVQKTAEECAEVYCTVGIHPHSAGEAVNDLSTEEIISRTHHAKVIGIGETGLDFYYDTAPRREQEDSFRRHIKASQTTGLPLIIHSRSAEEDTIRVLQDSPGATGVLHCFSSGRILAEEALKIGYYISLSGILTFKKSQELRDIARDVPLDRLLVETDSPYLAPEPYRGKSCEPSFVVRTAQVLAEIKGVSFETIAQHTSENFYRLFPKAVRP